MESNLSDFFNGYFQFENYEGEPICREERQYNLFLYKRLAELLEKGTPAEHPILAACGIGETGQTVVIHRIIYEVALMRDIFSAERRMRKKSWKNQKIHTPGGPLDCFNKRLYEYVYRQLHGAKAEVPAADWKKVPAGVHLGTRTQCTGLERGPMEKRLRQMMNAKPDLAILYSAGEAGKKEMAHYLKFLECKYLSRVSVYKDALENGRTQIEVQEDIGNFLCTRIADQIRFSGVQLVIFQNENRFLHFTTGNVLPLSELLPRN